MRLPSAILLLMLLFLPACTKDEPPPAPPEPSPGKVTITSEPTGAAVYQGRRERLGVTPLTLTRPDGTLLSLTLVKDGHSKVSFSVMAEAGKENKEHRALPRATGTLVVDAGLIKGAVIYIDGERRGKTPDRVEIPAGLEVLVEVRKNNYHPYREKATVKPDTKRRVTAMLVPANKKMPPIGWLTVTCDPPSRILLNGTSLGETPLERAPLPARAHRLRLENKTLNLVSERTIAVKASELTTLHVNLKEEANQ